MLALSVALPFEARADFIGAYDVSNFALVNSNANGFVDTGGAPFSISIVGGNNGSGLSGTTDFFVAAAGSGMVVFQYVYSSLDIPTFDFAGYLLGSSFALLADADGQSGVAQFPVASGDRFGFRVGTVDNTGEPGILTVSRFTAPEAPVPEPGGAPVLCAVVILGAVLKRGARLAGSQTELAMRSERICASPGGRCSMGPAPQRAKEG